MAKLFENKTNSRQLPTKRTINLIGAGEKPLDMRLAIPGIIVIIILAVIFSELFVVRPLAKAAKAESETASLRNMVNDNYDEIDSFGDIKTEYAHYTYEGLNSEEKSNALRGDVIEMLEAAVYTRAYPDSWTLNGNVLKINMSQSTLADLNGISNAIEAYDDLVDFCTVNTAATADANGYVTGSVTVYLKDATYSYTLDGEE